VVGLAEDSFGDFVRTWSPGLMRTAYLLTGDHGHAEDLVQTALMQVARRWRRLDRPDLAYAYARRTLVNTHTSWWRRRRVGEQLVDEHREGPPATHEYFAPADRTAEALRSLPPGMRAVVVLRFHEDLTEADTAAVLGCSVGTVKSQTSRALARMREHLAAAELPTPAPAATSCTAGPTTTARNR
jgi:RNA polymerase sigma-70 factor (sigma-E family)